MKTFEMVPVYLAKAIENGELKLEDYCRTVLGLEEPKILIRKIKINALFELEGFRMHLSGRTNNQLLFKNARQLCLEWEKEQYIKQIGKMLENGYANGISPERNLAIYDLFLEMLNSSRFKVKLSAQIETLSQGREKFENLTLEDQCMALNEILKLFQCNSLAANLKKIGGPERAGILVLNSDITKIGNLYLIDQSPTGFFEKKVEISSL